MEKKPSWWVSLIPFAVLVGLLALVIRFYGADSLDGGSQTVLVICTGLVLTLALVVYKIPWKVLDEAIMSNVKSIGSALIILLLIGAIAGSWMISGIVPTLICYGLKILSPKIFLLAVCIICCLVSLMTGSSWTTVATIGVAFIGIGMALGYSAPLTAGAIISGSYFGDKISPLSDTTNLAASVTETQLFSHIRYMMVTTVPSIVIASLIYLVISLMHNPSSDIQVEEIAVALKSSFHISPWLLVVPVLTGVLIAKKVPALLTLLAAALMAIVTALIAQPELIASIGGGESTLNFSNAFRGSLVCLYGDTAVMTGNEMLDELVQTHGMCGMLSTIFLIICAAAFGGAMTGAGMIQSITEMLTRRITKRTSMVASTVGTGIFSNMVTGDQYLSIILTCSLYKDLYEKNGYESRLLSRSTEDSATVTSVLIPWNSCGMTQATVLRVPTIEYLPYCFFNIISPIMSITVAAIGYKIFRNGKAIR